MIWFACKHCGRKHSRPESSTGSLIFCDCGQGITVPWESTIEEPELVLPVEPVAPPPLSGPPRMVAMPVGEERVPVSQRPRPDEAIPVVRPARGRRRPPIPVRDRNYCFNHQDLPIERTCESCTERFCGHCLVTFQKRVLCGPCKNAVVRALDEAPKISVLAVTSALLALAVSVVGFCLLPLGTTLDMLPLAVFTLLIQLVVLGLAGLAWYRVEKTPLVRGKSLAITGILAAGLGIVLTVAATMYSYMQWV